MTINYTEDDIKTLVNLESVRKRPTKFIVSVEIPGQVHVVQEILSNAIDELMQMAAGLGHITVLMCKDVARNTYQMVVRDNGRGVPLGKLLKVFTVLDTSGKFDTNSYKFSGGLYGVGAKVAAGTSNHFRAITDRTDGSGSIAVNGGIADHDIVRINRNNAGKIATGTMVLFEPDSAETTIDTFKFIDVDKFSEFGYRELVLLIQKQCFFRPYNIDFKIYPLPLPSNIWTCPIDEARTVIDSYIAEGTSIFAEVAFDRLGWIKHYWNSTRPYIWSHSLHHFTHVPGTPALEYIIHYYYAKYETANMFGMVNNVPIDDPKSSHTSVTLDILKALIGPLIKDASVRQYYFDSYKLPISIAVDIKYEGAEFTGTTKHAFNSREFKAAYSKALLTQMNINENLQQFKVLYELLAEDIEAKYEAQIGNISKSKDFNRLSTELIFADKFKDCSTINRKLAELFVVEGDSAGGSTGRDPETQGIYTIRGKPFNSVKSIDHIRQSRVDLQNDDIYHDIIKIMGINPSKFNLEDLYFGSLIITTDADSDGYHISQLLVGNLYVLCPPLIEAGVIHIATPPLYSIEVSKRIRSKDDQYIYFRTDEDLNTWMCENVFMETFDIHIKSPGIFDKYQKLSEHEFKDFIKLVLEIGDAIVNVANELVLDPQTIEALSYVTQYMDPFNVNTQKIKEILGVDKVLYDPNGYVLIISHDGNDIIIPLQNVCSRLYDNVIPKLNHISWKKFETYITTKHTNVFKYRKVTLMQLYQLLKSTDSMFHVDRYKGLGSMPVEDRVLTCMNPKYRTTNRVTSIGDVDIIYKCLGKDTGYRQGMLTVVK